jgi:hypothetical protein
MNIHLHLPDFGLSVFIYFFKQPVVYSIQVVSQVSN